MQLMQAGNKLKKVAILQSNYVPWKGYFDMIAAVDEFIIYDDVQFTKNDWRNRNKIKANGQVQWLTIPVRHSISDRIRDVKVSLDNWNIKHWKTLQANYGRALAFRDASDFLEELYRAPRSAYLSEINVEFIRAINSFLGIDTRVTGLPGHPTMSMAEKDQKGCWLCARRPGLTATYPVRQRNLIWIFPYLNRKRSQSNGWIIRVIRNTRR